MAVTRRCEDDRAISPCARHAADIRRCEDDLARYLRVRGICGGHSHLGEVARARARGLVARVVAGGLAHGRAIGDLPRGGADPPPRAPENEQRERIARRDDVRRELGAEHDALVRRRQHSAVAGHLGVVEVPAATRSQGARARFASGFQWEGEAYARGARVASTVGGGGEARARAFCLVLSSGEGEARARGSRRPIRTGRERAQPQPGEGGSHGRNNDEGRTHGT